MNELTKIVQTSGLEKIESQTIIEKFGNYEDIAKEWDAKAKMIVVTDKKQTTEMAMAREARKKFSQLRIDVEKARKEMKEQSLRKGQAIDAVARYLVSLIAPIEQHLKEQEDFTKILEAKQLEESRIEAEKKAEAERIAQEEAERKEQERIRKENERLKVEAEAREKAMQVEREKAEAQRLELEEKARKEAEAREKAQEELKASQEATLREKEEAERKEKERIAIELKAQQEALRAPDKEKYSQYVDALKAVEAPDITDPLIRDKVAAIREYLIEL